MSNVVAHPSARFGATVEEWTYWSRVAPADLLPVVSNPNAVRSPASTLTTLGKVPSRYNASRQAVGIRKWVTYDTTAAELAAWAREPDYGISVRTGGHTGFVALDVDVSDVLQADAICRLFCEALGVAELPARVRAGTGKRLLLFRMAEPGRKRRFPVGDELVELLATGQQFIACGRHPSGTRYEWLEADTGPLIETDVLDRAWAAIHEAVGTGDAAGGGVVKARNRADLEGVEDPVADYLEDQGLVLDAQSEKLFVECPWKAGHSGDSGPSETAWLIAGTKGFINGHFQCMHASCAARKDEDFLDAVGYRAAQFPDLDGGRPVDAGETGPRGNTGAVDAGVSGEAHPPWPTFTRDGKGRIEATLGNVQAALPRPDIVGPRLIFDAFNDTLLADGRPFTDGDAVRIRTLLERRGFRPVGRELFRDALVAHQEAYVFDSAQDWLTGLPAWDGVLRCETTLPRLFATDDTPYTRAVGAYMWTALAGRIMAPGCKADMVVALQGAQGLGKSGGVERLAPSPEMFRELSLHRIDADLSRKLRGCVVAELAELQGLRTRDKETIRAWIVQKSEVWRPLYTERDTSFQRRCVFFATVNPQEFLDDEEGERRWLPVTIRGGVDWAGIEAEREQLWAEGLLRWSMDGVAWQDPERLARGEHAQFKVRDDWEPLIARWLAQEDVAGESPNSRNFITSTDVAMGALGLDARSINRLVTVRVGKVLRHLQWESGAQRVEGEVAWGWKKPDV